MHALSTLQARDGIHLALHQWPVNEPRGVVVLVHGLGEHLGRYHHVAQAFNRHGWKVVGCDHRGHGASGGARGALRTHEDMLYDLAAVIDFARSTPGPVVVVGHSMGGLVSARLAAGLLEPTRPAWARDIDALVLSSPALDLGLSTTQKMLMATVGRWLPDLAVPNGVQAKDVSHDPAVASAYLSDPLVHNKITGRLGRFFLKEGAATRAMAPRWRLPTLLMYAGSDRLVAPGGSDEFADRAPAECVTSRRYDQLFHEILNEPQKDQILGEINAWMARRFAPSSSSKHADIAS